MCGSSPKASPPPAAAVPLPAEVVKPATVEVAGTKLKPKKSGRAGLSIPEGGATVTGLSGLNIPT